MTHTASRRQLARLLSLIPYLRARPGVSPDDVCRIFDIDRVTLDADLELLWMCGLPPYDPFALIDVERDDAHITVSSADYFARPVTLTVDEGRALASALSILGEVGGEALRTLRVKVEKALGSLPADARIQVSTDQAAPSEVLATLRTGIDEHRTANISYYSASRDALQERTIEPYRLINVGGQWYVRAFCRSANGMRLFRLDRIEHATLAADCFTPGHDDATDSYEQGVLYTASPGDEVARVRFSPQAARWATETWPAYERGEATDGSVTIGIPYARREWMIAQLLPYGPEARILGPLALIEAFVVTARRLAALYSDAAV